MPSVTIPTINEPVTISAADQRLQHCADPESIRYALGGVYFNSRVAVACDGRILAAKFKTSDPHDCVIGFAKSKQTGKSRKLTYHPIAGRLATIDGKQTAEPIEGQFPRWQDVVPTTKPTIRVIVRASQLMQIANALQDGDDEPALILEIIDNKTAIVIRSNDSVNGAAVMM